MSPCRFLPTLRRAAPPESRSDSATLAVALRTTDTLLSGQTADISEGGMLVRLEEALAAVPLTSGAILHADIDGIANALRRCADFQADFQIERDRRAHIGILFSDGTHAVSPGR